MQDLQQKALDCCHRPQLTVTPDMTESVTDCGDELRLESPTNVMLELHDNVLDTQFHAKNSCTGMLVCNTIFVLGSSLFFLRPSLAMHALPCA